MKWQNVCWVMVLVAGSLKAQDSVVTDVQQPLQVPQPMAVDPQSWQLYQQQPDLIMRYTDTLLGDKTVLGIQIQLTYQGQLSAFFRVLRDTDQAILWLDSAKSVVVIASPNPYEDWVLTTFDTPWPLQQREMVTCSRWKQHVDYSIEMNVVACPQLWPVAADTVRINQLSAQWRLTPLPNQRIQLSYTGTADAGGGVLRWLSDPVALASSWRSFQALQQRLSLPEYQQALSEVCEPHFNQKGQRPTGLDKTSCRSVSFASK